MTIFGPSYDGSDAERALLAHLELWMPTYIPEIRRQKDPKEERWPDGVEAINAFEVKHFASDKWPEDQLPCLIAYATGMADDPAQEGEGTVNARYVVSLIAIAESVDEHDTKELARLYASAARMAIFQHPNLSEVAECIAMGREAPYPVRKGVDAERTLMAVEIPYVIELPTILNVNEGPSEPLPDPEDPPGDWPKVKEDGGSVEVSLVDELSESGFFD